MFLHQPISKWLSGVFVMLSMVACSDAGNLVSADPGKASPTANRVILDVFKSPTCGCCEQWIAHLEESGIHAITHNLDNLSALKASNGVMPAYQSCHTAIAHGGYVFEGHVPAKYIEQFLSAKPQGAIGLSVPGMHVGTPGMEAGNNFSPYDILLLKSDNTVEVYAQINSAKEQY